MLIFTHRVDYWELWKSNSYSYFRPSVITLSSQRLLIIALSSQWLLIMMLSSSQLLLIITVKSTVTNNNSVQSTVTNNDSVVQSMVTNNNPVQQTFIYLAPIMFNSRITLFTCSNIQGNVTINLYGTYDKNLNSYLYRKVMFNNCDKYGELYCWLLHVIYFVVTLMSKHEFFIYFKIYFSHG